jgi:hypothetical protein
MSLSGVYELLLRGLAGEADPNSLQYIAPDQAHADLKRRTGKDFGYDLEKWRAFLCAHREALGVGKFERLGCMDGSSSLPLSTDEPVPSNGSDELNKSTQQEK